MSRLMELNDIEFSMELFDSFREKNIHPDEYAEFTDSHEVRERTIAAFREAIDKIKSQLDAYAHLEEDREPEWAVRARGAKRHYEREHARLNHLRMKANTATRNRKRQENHARYTEHSRLLHDLLETLALRVEQLDGSVADLDLPSSDGTAPISLDEWLDLREERREKRAARDVQ